MERRNWRIMQRDAVALAELLDEATAGETEVRELLDTKLDQARILRSSRIPRDLVGIGSQVRFLDEDTNQERTATIVVPSDATPVEDGEKISVLAPLGCLLLGLSQGETADWVSPGKKRRRLRVIGIVRQPA